MRKKSNKYNEEYLDNLELTEEERFYYESGKSRYVEVLDNQSDAFSQEYYDQWYETPEEYGEEEINRLYSAIEKLTEKQQEAILGLLCGYSQEQIAKDLNVTQCSIHCRLLGSRNYSYEGKAYGGAINKLRKLLKTPLNARGLP